MRHLIPFVQRVDGHVFASLSVIEILPDHKPQVLGSVEIAYFQDQRSLGVRRLYVDLKHRRQKIGTALMWCAVTIARLNQCRAVEFTADKKSGEAYGFYHSLGLQPNEHPDFPDDYLFSFAPSPHFPHPPFNIDCPTIETLLSLMLW